MTNWRILDADGYANASSSSSGAHRVGEDSVEFSTGHNANGLVARWVDIRPGADGTFTIRTSHSAGEAAGGLPGASAYQGYAGGLFLLAEQTALGSGGAEGIEIISVFPPAGSTQTHPNAPVRVLLQTGALAVNADSVDLRLNGATVSVEVLVEEDFTTLIHQPATLFASGSSHTVAVSFTDNAPEPRSITREWSFAVLDYGSAVTVPSSLGVPFNPAIHRTRGFALEMFAVDPAIYTLMNVGDAEALLESDLENLADSSIFNPLGYFIEMADLNYQVDGLIRGFRAEDRHFPGISRVDDSVVLQWAGGGTLQSAPAVTGSWSNVPNASSPHSAPLTGRQQYFRVRP